MLKYLSKEIKLKEVLLSLCVIGGFTTPSWAMNEELQHHQEEGEVKSTTRKLNTLSPRFANLSDSWGIEEWPNLENANKIVTFPEEYAYNPEFIETYDTLILMLSNKPEFLDYPWKQRGLSCHGIVEEDGKVVVLADPFKKEKGKMAGKWNSRSVGIVCLHPEGSKQISTKQQVSLKKYMDLLKGSNKFYGGSVWQAKQIEGFEKDAYTDSKIENIEEVLKFIDLAPLDSFFTTADDIVNKK